jgi:hypothetical protein
MENPRPKQYFARSTKTIQLLFLKGTQSAFLHLGRANGR